jgi:hypothetical protein
MIDLAIQHVAAQLNDALRGRFAVPDDLVVASSLLEPDGNVVPEVSNKIVVFLVNVERDTMPLRALPQSGAGRLVQTREPVFLNLLVMFAANFSGNNYREALKLLAGTIGFLQARPVFDRANSPGLDARFERITMEIENLNTAELSNLWGILGSRYLPSVLYRLRMVTIDEGQVITQVPRVQRPDVAAQA